MLNWAIVATASAIVLLFVWISRGAWAQERRAKSMLCVSAAVFFFRYALTFLGLTIHRKLIFWSDERWWILFSLSLIAISALVAALEQEE